MVAVLFVVTSWDELGNTGQKTGWYLPEVAHPYYIFKDANFTVTFCSPKGGKAPMDPGSAEAFKDDTECKKFLEDNEAQEKINNTTAAEKIDAKNFQIVFYAGGHGPMWDIPDNEHLKKISAQVYESGGILSGVCHGVVGLLNVTLSNGINVIHGKDVTCFTNSEEDAVNLSRVVPFMLETALEEKGATVKKGSNFTDFTVSCDRLITGQNPASGKSLGTSIVEKAKELKL